VTPNTSKFRNIIVCEDVRDEIGNKKSLMGVMGGDILVATFPATLQIAIFFEYLPSDNDPDSISVSFRILIDDAEVATGNLQAAIANKSHPVMFVLPRGFVTFEKPATFKFCATVSGKSEEELVAKTIGLNPPS
jgi:hypothetical protein